MRILRVILTILILLPSFCFPAYSQRPDSFWGKIVNKITAPSMELDPSAVYQPAQSWSIAVSGEMHQAGITQDNQFNCIYTYDEADGGGTENLQAFTWTKLQGGVDKVIGLQVGYGNLSLGLNRRIGVDKENTNTSFSFDYLTPGYAVQLQYFNFRRHADYEMKASLGDMDLLEGSGKTNKPGRMTTFIADAFYAFNRSSFAYSAVYKGNVVQRRSSGSWLFGIKYLQGLVEYDPDDEDISDVLFGLFRQNTRQASFGGGFSYNLVPFHRQPGDNGKGLRNLTFNLTAIPMVTIFNQFTSTMKNDLLEGDPVWTKNVINGKMHANYVLKAGAIYSWDRLFIGVAGSYDSYNYQGSTDIPAIMSDENFDFDKIYSSGSFFRWSANLKLCVKF